MSIDSADPTSLLVRWSEGDNAALGEVVELLYAQMHQIAARHLRAEFNPAIEPTELVNEVYLRLLQLNRIQWQDRSHFLAMFARVSRRALVDEARKVHAAKRDARLEVTLTAGHDVIATGGYSVIEIDQLLSDLASFDETAARVIELRVFGGLNIDEVSAELALSESTVNRKWRSGKAWLTRQLGVALTDE